VNISRNVYNINTSQLDQSSIIVLCTALGSLIREKVSWSLGVPAYIIADGDALGAARKYPANATRQASAHASHQSATNDITSWLPSSSALEGVLPYSFEDPTTIARHFTIWEDDIEEELSKWPSFMSALATNGSTLRSKDLLVYRAAVLDVQVADLPNTLKTCVSAILNWGR